MYKVREYTGLPLTLFPIRITLVLWRKRPRLRRRTKKHLGNFDPILAVWTCEKRFYANVVALAAAGQVTVRTYQVHPYLERPVRAR